MMASELVPDPFIDTNIMHQPLQPSQKKTWQEIRQTIKAARKAQSTIASKVPHSFTFRPILTEYGLYPRLYFLGIPDGCRENTLLYSDLMYAHTGAYDPLTPNLTWHPILDSMATQHTKMLSKEEQLLRERKRMSHFGITSYDVHSDSGHFVFPMSGGLYDFHDMDVVAGTPGNILPQPLVSRASNPKMDPKVCPRNTNLIAFISSNDIWTYNCGSGAEKQLTFSHTGLERCKTDVRSAGVPSFVVQEEFDRYTGYWWRPSGSQNRYSILYEEVDESDVELTYIMSSSEDESGYDEYRYPRAGTPNAKSELKIVEFEINETTGEIDKVVHRHLTEPLMCSFPWMEYLVRAGWTPDGAYIWCELLDRVQQRLELILIPPECFVSEGADFHMNSLESGPSPAPQVIYSDTSDMWVNTHDILHFFPQHLPDRISFIWLSEKTGFSHLYCVTSQINPIGGTTSQESAMDLVRNHQESTAPNVINEIPLTSGDWEVIGKQFWVDSARSLLYFMGLKDTPLETHLYVTPYTHPGSIQRLTELGYSHSISMDADCKMFVSVYSSISTSPCCYVYKLVINDEKSVTSQVGGCLLESQTPENYQAPEIFKFKSQTGNMLHGMMYRPHNFEEGKKYPVIQFVYGGPQVQLVTNAYKGTRFLRLHILATLGYAVVVIDGRGSVNRGLAFESHLKFRMGMVEIDDQVEGLKWVSRNYANYLDLTRVAIHGWSYGGYLSLMGLTQRPDVYRLAIAGAPVTCWELYDTGYTERYMSLPSKNPEGYKQGSVLENVDKFPTEENRLLIVHGLIDENVHFKHTNKLVNALIKACKPYHIQVYPNERHGIRSQEANEHYETMLISFLQEHL
ncbi:dipeptidyl peptidase 9-like [Lineus longissimus]|uniref:dipeptidyl peptidase 9-like n=1 Tax=Lineus longissimus TaxID=88925 RepID=UPI002B4DBE64